MTSFSSGRQAEATVAAYLQRNGCRIVAQNWRNQWCEIDIVATRNGMVYFCEVKYRRTSLRGTGLAYITPQKLQHMRRAARHWIYENQWRGSCQMCAIEVSGANFCISNVVKNLG